MMPNQTSTLRRWTPLPEGTLKINIDGAFVPNTLKKKQAATLERERIDLRRKINPNRYVLFNQYVNVPPLRRKSPEISNYNIRNAFLSVFRPFLMVSGRLEFSYL